MRNFDLVICQRLNSYEIIKAITNAAFLLNLPVVMETDDDYVHLERTNPCYFGTALDNALLDRARAAQMENRMDDLNEIMPQLEQSRVIGLEGYKKALSFFDAVTVTTQELKETILPYNKNVKVLKNNMEKVHPWRDYSIEQSTADGKMINNNLMGMRNVPSHYMERNPQTFEPITDDTGNVAVRRIYRVGYACTATHRTDFTTIYEPWNELILKWGDRTHFVYIGDPWFYRTQKYYTGPKTEQNPEGDGRPNRRIHIEESTVPMYLLNLRVLDCFIAPLEKTIFNMSKSDLKALECASWGACPVLPDYVTYWRHWEHGKTAFLYKNEKEFYEIIDHLLTHPAVMEQIGRQARDYVSKHRLEKDHAQERFDFYKNLIESKRKPVVITPNRVAK